MLPAEVAARMLDNEQMRAGDTRRARELGGRRICQAHGHADCEVLCSRKKQRALPVVRFCRKCGSWWDAIE